MNTSGTAKKSGKKSGAAEGASAKNSGESSATGASAPARRAGEPSAGQPGGTNKKTAGAKPSAGGSTAPAVKAEYARLIARIEASAREAGVVLPRGASAPAFARLERRLGFELPDEVRAWYLAHDGGGSEFVLENRELLSLERIADEWKIWKDLLDEGVFGANAHSEPGPGVQKKWWIPEWVPVTYDGSGNHDVVDLAPGKGGRRGQIVSFWHDDPSRRVVGRSFLTWLAEREWGGD